MCQPPKEPPVDAAAAIKELYARHDPGKLNEVDALLTKFKGREAQLLQAVTAKYCPDDVDRFAKIVQLFSEDADVNRMLRGFDDDATAKGIDKRRLIMFKCPTVDTLVVLGDKQNLMTRMSSNGVELDISYLPIEQLRPMVAQILEAPGDNAIYATTLQQTESFDPAKEMSLLVCAPSGAENLVRPMLVPRLSS